MIENEKDPNTRAVAEIIAILTSAPSKINAETEPAFAYELKEPEKDVTENPATGDLG